MAVDRDAALSSPADAGATTAGGGPTPLAILGHLPATLEWAVLFDLAQVLDFASTSVARGAFFLAADEPLDRYSHVVLTSAGSRLVVASSGALVIPGGAWAPLSAGPSLADAYAPHLAAVETDGALCVGLGTMPPFEPVMLSVRVEGDAAIGTALLASAPTAENFELLPACGVTFLGSVVHGQFHLARFRNRLSTHLLSGLLAGFSRTGNCNLFFLRHTEIDEPLKEGLVRAGWARRAAARGASLATLSQLVLAARRDTLAMTCRSPGGQAATPYGDLVPLGFVARALAGSQSPPNTAALELVRRHLVARSESGLWAFHSGRLVTATDSALVLLGIPDREATAALERFADGAGAYLPQLAAADDRPGHMRETPATRHWRQADLGTTLLIRALRREAGLDERTPLALLEAAFDQRSALYFANPYLVDWFFALAIKDDPQAAALRARLLAEVTASANPDFSFGRYDVALSTALAILTLAALGARGRLLHCAQVRLLDLVDELGAWPISTPFYSTVAVEAAATSSGGLIPCGDEWHALSLYEDTYRMIGTAVATLALGEESNPALGDLPHESGPHNRYLAVSATDYIRRFALPPYLPARATA